MKKARLLNAEEHDKKLKSTNLDDSARLKYKAGGNFKMFVIEPENSMILTDGDDNVLRFDNETGKIKEFSVPNEAEKSLYRNSSNKKGPAPAPAKKEEGIPASVKKANNEFVKYFEGDEIQRKEAISIASELTFLEGLKSKRIKGYSIALIRNAFVTKVKGVYKRLGNKVGDKFLELVRRWQTESGVTIFTDQNKLWKLQTSELVTLTTPAQEKKNAEALKEAVKKVQERKAPAKELAKVNKDGYKLVKKGTLKDKNIFTDTSTIKKVEAFERVTFYNEKQDLVRYIVEIDEILKGTYTSQEEAIESAKLYIKIIKKADQEKAPAKAPAKRSKAALMKDRKYTSEEKHEKAYKRKGETLKYKKEPAPAKSTISKAALEKLQKAKEPAPAKKETKAPAKAPVKAAKKDDGYLTPKKLYEMGTRGSKLAAFVSIMKDLIVKNAKLEQKEKDSYTRSLNWVKKGLLDEKDTGTIERLENEAKKVLSYVVKDQYNEKMQDVYKEFRTEYKAPTVKVKKESLIKEDFFS